MLKQASRHLRNRAKALGWRIGSLCGVVEGSRAPVSFVVERADWSIRWDGEHIRDVVNELTGQTTVEVSDAAHRVTGPQVVHFGSQYMWLDWGRLLSGRNRYAVTFFHGKPEDGPEVERHIEQFLKSVPALDKVVTAASLIEQRLLGWGVPRDKLVRIPIGVDTRAFRRPTEQERQQARQRFAFQSRQVVIGSFQKDGVGWGDGMEPKLIKGPDLFVAAVARMARDLPVAVLLTGPARGYVMRELERRQIPFVHTYVKDQVDIADCYHALDLYLVTSREEGGPKGIMEGMASGVPLVSTRVGMASDLIEDGITGGLVLGGTATEIAAKAMQILSHDDPEGLRARARKAVLATDWSEVGKDHWYKVYQPALRS